MQQDIKKGKKKTDRVENNVPNGSKRKFSKKKKKEDELNREGEPNNCVGTLHPKEKQ